MLCIFLVVGSALSMAGRLFQTKGSMNNCSHGVSDDMSCAYDQAKLETGNSSEVVPVQKDKSFEVAPNVDKGTDQQSIIQKQKTRI